MSFYITLPSNVVDKSFPNNTIANYTTILNQRISLKDKWEIGLSEISYTKSWYNVLNTHKILLYDEIGNYENTNDLLVFSGFYESEDKLVNEINSKFSTLKNIKPPKLFYNKLNNKINIEAGFKEKIKIYPSFGNEIDNILGLKNRNMNKEYYQSSDTNEIEIYNGKEMFINKTFEAFHSVEITAGYHSLFVYCNIVCPSHIGDTCAPLLRVVEVSNKSQFGEQCVIKYENPQYRSILLNEFSNIEISILDDSGNLIPFKFGRSIVTLHFKKL